MNHKYIKIKVTKDGELKHRREANIQYFDGFSFSNITHDYNKDSVDMFISSNIQMSRDRVFVYGFEGNDDQEVFIGNDDIINGMNIINGKTSQYIRAPQEVYSELYENLQTYSDKKLLVHLDNISPFLKTKRILCKDCYDEETCIFNTYLELNKTKDVNIQEICEYLLSASSEHSKEKLDEGLSECFGSVCITDYTLYGIGLNIYYDSGKCLFDTKIILSHKSSV